MDYKDEDKLAKAVLKWINKAQTIAIEKAALFALSKIKQEFKLQQTAEGKRWKPLKESTIETKIRQGYSEKILHKTTTLKQSFFADIDKENAVVGTPVKYAIFHEEGTKHIPKRPFVKPVEKVLAENLPDIVEASLKEAD